jgi:hypothetical protein
VAVLLNADFFPVALLQNDREVTLRLSFSQTLLLTSYNVSPSAIEIIEIVYYFYALSSVVTVLTLEGVHLHEVCSSLRLRFLGTDENNSATLQLCTNCYIFTYLEIFGESSAFFSELSLLRILGNRNGYTVTKSVDIQCTVSGFIADHCVSVPRGW